MGISSASDDDSVFVIYIDAGTTRTRAWLVHNTFVMAHASRPIGARDVARTGSNNILKTTVRELISELKAAEPLAKPMAVVAAGMISSPQGFTEVPHVQSPATLLDIAKSSRWFDVPDVTDLPLLLVPGVRTGAATNIVDVMRGEETLCLGLLERGLISPHTSVLNLGSHWKLIRIDELGRIASSYTSISGELMRAAATQTILAGSVHTTVDWSPDGLSAGMSEQRASGLGRALFCVRLSHLSNSATPEERTAFLAGAFIASDFDSFQRNGLLSTDDRVAIVGHSSLAKAWHHAMRAASIHAVVIEAEQARDAFLAGLGLIFQRAPRPTRDVAGVQP